MRTMLFCSVIALGTMGACKTKTNDDRRTVEVQKPLERETTAPKHVDVDVDIDKERGDLSTWVNERVNRLDAKIDALAKKGDEKSKAAAATLREKRDQARGKMSELGNRTKDNWGEFKKDVTSSWDQLERDVDDATR